MNDEPIGVDFDDLGEEVFEPVAGGPARYVGRRDRDGNVWETVCGGPPRMVDSIVCK